MLCVRTDRGAMTPLYALPASNSGDYGKLA